MTVLLVGVSHRSAALDVRERLHFPDNALAEALARLRHSQDIRECLLVSTCNRTEVLVATDQEGSERAPGTVKSFLCQERSITAEELDRVAYVKAGLDAVRHMFRLGVGLDSMILGEPQILGQVKSAYGVASEAGTLGAELEPLLQRSFSVAKKVRTSTHIGRNPVSISFAAVDLAHQIFGDLQGRSVLVLGAGKMAELALRHIAGSGVASIAIANRSFERAEAMAREFQGKAVAYDRFPEELVQVDIVLSSTAAPHPILTYEQVQRVMRLRRSRPLFLIDVAVPRNIEQSVNRLDNVYLYDIDDLQHVADSGLEERRAAAEEAEKMVEMEVSAYEGWARKQEIKPTIVALREKLLGLRDSEVERYGSRLRELAPEHRKTVEELTASLINKVLHGPIDQLKRSVAADGKVEVVDIVRELFGLAGANSDGSRPEEEPSGPGSAASQPAGPDEPDDPDAGEVRR